MPGLSAVKGLSSVDGARPASPSARGTKLAEIAAAATLAKEFPSLAESAGDIGQPANPQHGHTLGGNLCQARHRCLVYFRDGASTACSRAATSASRLDRREPLPRRLHSRATSASSFTLRRCPRRFLIAAGPSAESLGPTGKRTLPLAKFFNAPRHAGHRARRSLLAPRRGGAVRPGGAAQAARTPVTGPAQASRPSWPLVQAAVRVQARRRSGRPTSRVVARPHRARRRTSPNRRPRRSRKEITEASRRRQANGRGGRRRSR